MNDLNALLRAVITNPDDDTPRLMYADELDAMPTVTTPCPTCSPYADDSCPRCDGNGKVRQETFDPASGEYRSSGSKKCRECSGTGKFPPGYHPQRDPGSGRHEGAWANCQTCNGVSGTPGLILDTMNTLRAEFIRVSIQRHRLDDDIAAKFGFEDPALANDLLQQRKPIRVRELALAQQFPNITGAIQKVTWQQVENERGFASGIVTTAEDFLRGADAIVWHPSQKEEEVTEGPRKAWYDEMRPPEGDGWEIDTSKGSDGWERFDDHEERYWIRPRPCPDTAQPIRKVTLTTEPHERDFGTMKSFERVQRVVEYYRWPGLNFHLPPDPTG